jgi:hypothetical protein
MAMREKGIKTALACLFMTHGLDYKKHFEPLTPSGFLILV